MPKNKKPAGGRPARNFDPHYAAKTKHRPGDSSAGKPGSRSPGHRGYRAPEAEASAPKRRWTAQEKAGRDESRAIRDGRGHRDGGYERRDGGYRQDRGFRDDRQDRGYRQDRDNRGFGQDRAPRRDDRDDRGYRGARRDDGAPRRDDRGSRPSYRDDRNQRPSYRDDRAPRRDERGSRPSYRDAQGSRPSYRDAEGSRPSHRDDRAPRRDDRFGHRDDRGQRPPYRDDRRDDRGYGSDRGARSDRTMDRSGDRAQRPAYRDDRGPRRDDRAQRPSSRDDRGARPSYRDSDRRSFDRNDRRDSGRRDVDHRDQHASAQHEEHIDVVHEKLQAEAVQADAGATASFADLGLGDNIVRALAGLGAEHPFPIQAATIGPILAGKDVLGRGRTGSGKTIAFGAPLVESILRSKAGVKREFGRAPVALILAPTRELALQIDRTVQPIARSVGLFTTQIYGGVPQARQVGALKKGVDIIIGTPGRIEDLHEQGKLDLSQVRVVVLDEADHMSELGFLEPMQRILRLVADGAQKLLFSATLDREVAALVDEFLVEPAVYEVAGEDQDSGTIDHRVLVIDHRDKPEILNSLVDRDGKTLVFSRTRAYTEMLAEQFEEAGIRAVALHGDLNQAKRSRNLQRLTDGKVNVLVATDVAARGIHVDDIDLVVQADAPSEYKTYLHRSGRTGRAGRPGTVVTLVPRQRQRRMSELLERAEIDAPFTPARPGDDLLEELSGRQVDPMA
ncbi:DEAD/DEAH box helicase [Microbacterium sp. KR10-403]|uniref:DEAD/DEAH box helicase n=1 Tax=Microbacterium sp. KR10-403 TaxID=3158581 RepID=UPI0032E50967